MKVEPLKITKSPWISAEYKPPRVYHNTSRNVLVFNKSHGRDMHIAWFDFDLYQWRNNYGEIINVTHWTELPEPPQRNVV